MATVYEIVQGLSQAAANAFDGALTEDGEALTAGLKEKRVIRFLIKESWMVLT